MVRTTSKPPDALEVARLEDLSMFYAWTPSVHVRAWLSEDILEDVKHNLVRVVTNSVNVLCVT